LLPMLDRLLSRHDLSPAQLDALAVTRGPGSFTSVRIGLATALGLAYPRSLPVYALNTLEVLAGGNPEPARPCLVMLDARKGEVYGGLYRAGEDTALIAPRAALATELLQEALQMIEGRLVLLGEGVQVYRESLAAYSPDRLHWADPALNPPDARRLGSMVLARLRAGKACEPAAPLYLRRSEAEVRLGQTAPGSEPSSL
jgi:tRNA threonylcarbamoyladenosine biosynthesis protein TsaB